MASGIAYMCGYDAGRYLHHGSRLPRFRSSLYVYSKSFNVYYKGQKQFQLSPSLLSQGRQKHRFAMRPNDKTQRLLYIAGLSCCSTPHRLLRHRDKQKIRVFNKQLYFAGFDNCSTLQVPLEHRNFFQMDQTVSANPDILWNQCQRRKDSNLDSHQHLRSCRNRQERTQNRTEFERNPANSQHRTFRESSYHTSTYESYFAKRKIPVS